MSVPTERATRRAGLMGSCAVVNLHGPYPVAGLSSGKRSDLSCNVPDEPAQLAPHRPCSAAACVPCADVESVWSIETVLAVALAYDVGGMGVRQGEDTGEQYRELIR